MEKTVAMGRMGGHTLLLFIELGDVYRRVGRLADAMDLAGRALELSRAHQARGYQAYTLRLLGDIAMHRDPPAAEPAEDHYRQALSLAEDLGMRPLVAHCHHSLGTLYSQVGRMAPARTELVAAIELYRAMDMTFCLPQAEAALTAVER